MHIYESQLGTLHCNYHGLKNVFQRQLWEGEGSCRNR